MTRKLQDVLNESNPSKIATALQLVKIGNVVDLAPKFVKGAVTTNVLALPNDAKAVAILSALRTAGTVVGYATPVLPGATLATNQVKVNQLGNIEFFATDAVTAAEVVYVTAEGDVVVDTIPVVAGTGIGTLDTDAVQLISAVVTAGTSLGAKTVLARAESAPAAGNVNLGLTANQVRFAVADAVTQATVTYIAKPNPTVDALVRSNVDF
jgi:hypothetical protein